MFLFFSSQTSVRKMEPPLGVHISYRASSSFCICPIHFVFDFNVLFFRCDPVIMPSFRTDRLEMGINDRSGAFGIFQKFLSGHLFYFPHLSFGLSREFFAFFDLLIPLLLVVLHARCCKDRILGKYAQMLSKSRCSIFRVILKDVLKLPWISLEEK